MAGDERIDFLEDEAADLRSAGRGAVEHRLSARNGPNEEPAGVEIPMAEPVRKLGGFSLREGVRRQLFERAVMNGCIRERQNDRTQTQEEQEERQRAFERRARHD